MIVLVRTNCISTLRSIDKRFSLNDRSASLAYTAIKVGELAEWITDVQEKNITTSNLLAADYHFSDELLQASVWWRTAMEELRKHDTQSLSTKQKESVKNIERLIVDAKAVKGITHESLLPF